MITQAPRRGQILLAVVFVLTSIALTMFVWQKLGGQMPLKPHGYQFHALFPNASTLSRGADVRIAGVNVGRVTAVRQRGLRADATMELQSQYAPLASDAKAQLRLKSLLGETFVEIAPGSRGAPRVPDGGRLASSRVVPTQPLDRIVGMLDAPTRRNIDSLLSSGATSLQGRWADLNDALGNLDPVTAQLAAISQLLDGQTSQLRGLIRDGGTVLQTVGERQSALRGLITQGDRLFAATAARDSSLTAATRALPGFLSQLRTTSGNLLTTTRLARSPLAKIKPVAPLVPPALHALREASPELRDLLVELRQAIPTAKAALPATAHFLDTLTPFVESLYPAAREIVPMIQFMTPYRREIIATVANVGAATEATAPGFDGKPIHYLRALVPISEEANVAYRQRLASNRHNAYPAPGELSRLGTSGLQASSCANQNNLQPLPVLGTGAPRCSQQAPWTFLGQTRYFPHLERAGDPEGGTP